MQYLSQRPCSLPIGRCANLLRRSTAVRPLEPKENWGALEKHIRPILPPFAQQMIDDGVVRKFGPDMIHQNGRSILSRYLEQCRDAEDRHEMVVSFTLLMNRVRLVTSSCEKCLYQKNRCICDHVERTTIPHHLWVFQHVGEFGRSNNTGSLLCLVAGAKRTIRGIRGEEKAMLDHIAQNRESTIVLFPNRDSVTVDQFRHMRSRHGKELDRNKPLTLILLDGTSRQAKNLDRFMPSYLPRIRLREAAVQSWLNPIRKQTEEHRVCTAQAAAMVLEQLGEGQASEVVKKAVHAVVQCAEAQRFSQSQLHPLERIRPSLTDAGSQEYHM